MRIEIRYTPAEFEAAIAAAPAMKLYPATQPAALGTWRDIDGELIFGSSGGLILVGSEMDGWELWDDGLDLDSIMQVSLQDQDEEAYIKIEWSTDQIHPNGWLGWGGSL